jgi:hypothetical protein
MEESNPPPWWSRRRVAAVVLTGFLTVGAAWVVFEGGGADGLPVQYLKQRPIRMPPAVGAAGAWLPDDAPIIGVSAGGRHRAYALNAFLSIDLHVANDLLGGVPVTVAYCDRTDCARVYIDPDGHQSLDVAVGGWAGQPGPDPDGDMLIRVGSDYYYQDTGRPLDGWGDFPYAEAEFERVTWGTWRRSHPDTDLVTGPRRPAH